MTDTPLLPCPFCGGPSIATEKPSRTGWRVMCHTDCDIFGDFDTREEAIAAWSRRAEHQSDSAAACRDSVLKEALSKAPPTDLACFHTGQTTVEQLRRALAAACDGALDARTLEAAAKVAEAPNEHPMNAAYHSYLPKVKADIARRIRALTQEGGRSSETVALKEALQRAAEQFRFYEKSHRAKAPPQLDKAEANAAMAVMCEALLK
jgi:hypothetical protein